MRVCEHHGLLRKHPPPGRSKPAAKSRAKAKEDASASGNDRVSKVKLEASESSKSSIPIGAYPEKRGAHFEEEKADEEPVQHWKKKRGSTTKDDWKKASSELELVFRPLVESHHARLRSEAKLHAKREKAV